MRFLMQRYQSVPTSLRCDNEFGTGPETSAMSSDSMAAEDDDEVFRVVTFKTNDKRNHASLSQAANSTLFEDNIYEEKEVENDTTLGLDDGYSDDNPIARRGRLFAQREKRRLVFKNGVSNVVSKNVLQRRRRYLVDIFTTLVDMRWRYNFIMFGFAFIGSWSMFGLLWWTIAVAHGDHLYPNNTALEPCVAGVYDFPTAFLFSVETQHTTGYGSRVIEPHCPQGIVLLLIQACCGIFIQSLMTGLIFAKLSRPKHRAHTMMFSQHAVICLRDGEYCLMFRLGDMRSTHLVDTSIRALIVMDRVTREGETVPLCQNNFILETETNFDDSFVFLVWPITFVHRIGPESPLWTISADKLLNKQFEIIVILEGVVESTGYCIQIRTSYLPSEIFWGHRLAPLITYEKCNGRYEIDFKQFHGIIPVTYMPHCSAKEFTGRAAEHHTFATSADEEYPINFTATSIIRQSSGASLRRLVRRRKSNRSKITSGDDLVSDKTTPSSTTVVAKRSSMHSISGTNSRSNTRKLDMLKKSTSNQ